MGIRTRAPFLLLALSLCCGGERSQAAQDPPPGLHATPAAAGGRHERPLPAFEGTTLSGERMSSSELLGRRSLLFFFDPNSPEAALVAQAVAQVAPLRGQHNFDVLAIGAAAARADLEGFVERHGFDFRVLDDSRWRIHRRLGLRARVVVVGVDAEGYISFGLADFPTDAADAVGLVESQLREGLRLPPLGSSLEPVLGEKPRAPDFRAERLEGGDPFDSRSLRGKPAILVFFLHTCPHCHRAFAVLKDQLQALPEEARPRLVGLSLSNRSYSVRQALSEQKLDYFPVLLDADAKIRNAYGATLGTPDIFLLDAEGRVVTRVRGWRDHRDPPLMRMWVARLAAQPIPMLLHQTGYSGNEFCVPCHEPESVTYELTTHAWAFDTLVRHGAERNTECVGCHVVGYPERGGYRLDRSTQHLEDVGCESCHGRGGPHLSPEFVQNKVYEPTCMPCHDVKHSLGFEYATFRPRISHVDNVELLTLSVEEKRKLLAKRAEIRPDLLPRDGRYVGSEACRGCHPAEYETWLQSPHARGVATLESKGEARKSECLACHTTAYGLPGGFPPGGSASGHPDLARVGCEACHGPGEAHVPEGLPKLGNIVSLGDKCDSCVIFQICGSCHDEANDPGFEFAIQDKIEAQRHGTIEPGTGKPKEAQADAGAPPAEAPGPPFADTKEG